MVNVIQVGDILHSTGATLLCGRPETLVHGVSTDTRTLEPRQLYLALSGPRFDGNRFALDACRRGAQALLVAPPDAALREELGRLPEEVAVCVHEAPRRALADLARWHRARLACPVIGVTGSAGKTTTKGMLAQLLGSRWAVVASPSSFNNDIGVPHTLLAADRDTRALVVEMGTNQPGEIAALCRIASPTAGVITNIGAAHLEGLSSTAGVAREKGALFECLPRNGFAVLNLDCPFAAQLRALAACRVISVSVEGAGDFDAREVEFHAAGSSFVLRGRRVTSPLLGVHNVSNLLLALAALEGLGLDWTDFLPAIAALRGAKGRMEKLELAGLTVFDDSYNANPQSAQAALRVLAGLYPRGRRVLVLGDMLELGAESAAQHRALGEAAARAGIERLILVGPAAREALAGARGAGLGAAQVSHHADIEVALERVPTELEDGDCVWIKASRGVQLDRLVQALIAARGRV